MPKKKKQWLIWRNKKCEDEQTSDNGVDQRGNNNEQSRNEGKKRRMQCRDERSRSTHQCGEGLQSGSLQHQQPGPSPKQQGPRAKQHGPSAKHQSQAGGQPGPSHGQCNEGQGATSTSPTSTSSNIGRHIPGFYFDPVKKRYFRLLPGHNNFNPYNEETIKQKEAEKRRLELLESGSALAQSCMNDLPSKNLCPSINQIIYQRQRGKLTSSSYERQCHEACITRMALKSSHQILTCPDLGSGYMTLLQADKDRKKMLTVISNERFDRFWQGTVKTHKHKSSQIDVNNWKAIHHQQSILSKLTSASWVSVDGLHDNHVLYSYSGGRPSKIQLFEQTDSRHILYDMSSYETIWTTSWSNNRMLANHLSVGGRKSYVVDIFTSAKTKLNTNGSDVFCQVFAKSQPLLYNGTRRGEVFSFDLRTPSQFRRKFASILHHTTSVCCLQLMNDENYIIASDMSGKIKMWDIRMCAVAREYHGNNNQHRHLPFKVDSTESILYTVGQDCFTRMWSIQTGSLLKTIPPPLPASRQTLPSVVYSTDWDGNAGLLLATQRQLDWYSLQPSSS